MNKITKVQTHLTAAQDYSSVSVWSKTIHFGTFFLFSEPSVSVRVTAYDRLSAGGGKREEVVQGVSARCSPGAVKSPEARLCIKVNLN